MSLTLSLSSAGELVAEFPGAQNSTRKLELRPGFEIETIIHVLQVQARDLHGIGTDAEPTSAQFHHWQFHADAPRQHCPFCKAEADMIVAGEAPITRLASRSRKIRSVQRASQSLEDSGL